jgi:hypothetical protein
MVCHQLGEAEIQRFTTESVDTTVEQFRAALRMSEPQPVRVVRLTGARHARRSGRRNRIDR